MVDSVEINGRKIKYLKFGNGSRVFVIIPGLSLKSVVDGAAAISYSYGIFSDEYTVYLFDRADDPPAGYTLRQMAADTVRAMKKIGTSKACFFGASQGGMILQIIAALYPDMTERIVLGSTAAKENGTFNEVLGKWAEYAVRKDKENLVKSTLESVYSPETLIKYGKALYDYYKDLSDAELERYLVLASACSNLDLTRYLKKIKCPVLVLGSYGDRVLTAASSIEIMDTLKCEGYIYPNEYGHAVYDEADDYKSRIKEFFERMK